MAWNARAPWPDLWQVEQDLIIRRALCDLFNAPALKDKIGFRGGTAIHKLLFKQPLRYSEDIDLVQTRAEPIGATVDAIRDALSWLGKCNRKHAGHSMHLVFKFAPETTTWRLKASRLPAQWLSNTQHDRLCQMLKGHYGYFGISGNIRRLGHVCFRVRRLWRLWLSRRSWRSSLSWERYTRLVQRLPLPQPRIVHRYTST